MALLPLALAGCGLGNYEEQLRREQARVKMIEEEKKLLGDPVEMPYAAPTDIAAMPASELPGPTDANVFVRPPKSFACKSKSEGLVGKGKVSLYGYSGTEGRNVLVGAYAADKTEKDFQEEIWQAFRDYLAHSRGFQPQQLPDAPKDKKHEKKPLLAIGREVPQVLDLDLWTWDEADLAPAKKDPKSAPADKDKKQEPSRYWIYFCRSGVVQAAVIYQVPLQRANDAAVARSIEASIKSLGVGPEAVSRRATYQKWK
jgi:hypothetical protein